MLTYGGVWGGVTFKKQDWPTVSPTPWQAILVTGELITSVGMHSSDEMWFKFPLKVQPASLFYEKSKWYEKKVLLWQSGSINVSKDFYWPPVPHLMMVDKTHTASFSQHYEFFFHGIITDTFFFGQRGIYLLGLACTHPLSFDFVSLFGR